MTIAKRRTEGFSPERAQETALAAVHAAGGEVSPWAHVYARKVATGEMDEDSAVREVIARSMSANKPR